MRTLRIGNNKRTISFIIDKTTMTKKEWLREITRYWCWLTDEDMNLIDN